MRRSASGSHVLTFTPKVAASPVGGIRLPNINAVIDDFEALPPWLQRRFAAKLAAARRAAIALQQTKTTPVLVLQDRLAHERARQ